MREKVAKARAGRTKDAGVDLDGFGTGRLDEVEDVGNQTAFEEEER